MAKFIFVLNGRAASGILADARREYPEHKPLVVLAPEDHITPPAEVEAITVPEALARLTAPWTKAEDAVQIRADIYAAPESVGITNATAKDDVVLVANGGTTEQQTPLTVRLAKGWTGGFLGIYQIVNLQAGQPPRVHDRRDEPLVWHEDRPVGELGQTELHFHRTNSS